VPRKTKRYEDTKFAPTVIRQAHRTFLTYIPDELRPWLETAHNRTTANATENWHFDKDDDFFAEYREDVTNATIKYGGKEVARNINAPPEIYGLSLTLQFTYYATIIVVELPERHQVQNVFEVFDDAHQSSQLPDQADSTKPVDSGLKKM
jgi:hypothetical protein